MAKCSRWTTACFHTHSELSCNPNSNLSQYLQHVCESISAWLLNQIPSTVLFGHNTSVFLWQSLLFRNILHIFNEWFFLVVFLKTFWIWKLAALLKIYIHIHEREHCPWPSKMHTHFLHGFCGCYAEASLPFSL